MLADPSAAGTRSARAFRYSRNLAVLHTDESFHAEAAPVWSSWNYLGARNAGRNAGSA